MEKAETTIKTEAVLKGFAKVKEKGVLLGRWPMVRHEDFNELLGVSRSTFKR